MSCNCGFDGCSWIAVDEISDQRTKNILVEALCVNTSHSAVRWYMLCSAERYEIFNAADLEPS